MGYWNENLFNKQHHGHVTWTAHTAATKLQTWNSFSLQDVLLQWHRAYPVLNPGKLMRPPVSAFKALMTSQWESVISSTSAKHTQTDTYWNAKENREQALRGCITAGTCKSLNWCEVKRERESSPGCKHSSQWGEEELLQGEDTSLYEGTIVWNEFQLIPYLLQALCSSNTEGQGDQGTWWSS